MKKISVFVLCFFLLSAALCACSQGQTPAVTEAVTTEATTLPPETKALIDTEAALTEALQTTGMAVLDGDIALTQQVVVRGGYLDGNGHSVTGPTYVEGTVETENAVTVMGGTVKNISISGAYRGIGDSSAYRVNADVHLNNIWVDSQSYTLNFGYGTGSTNLYVDNSTLLGWSSYTKFREAFFTDCTFGWDTTGDSGNLRPYINTTLTGCKFEGKVNADGSVTPFNIKFKSGSSGILLVLEDCYVGDTLITEENVSQLLGLDLQGNTLSIRNSR